MTVYDCHQPLKCMSFQDVDVNWQSQQAEYQFLWDSL